MMPPRPLNDQVKFSGNAEHGEIPQSLSPQELSSVSSSDNLEWRDLLASEITRRAISEIRPGSIVLFHNVAKHTPETLPGIIEALLQEGDTFAPLSQLILEGKYTTDHTGRQCPK